MDVPQGPGEVMFFSVCVCVSLLQRRNASAKHDKADRRTESLVEPSRSQMPT